MTRGLARRWTIAMGALLWSSACTVHEMQTPALTGPSEFALSLTLTATPDSISHDGGSQSSVRVTAKGPDGRALAGLALRLDMRVNGTPQDYGTLSARTIVTGSDGTAFVVYTAPPAPPGGIFGTCAALPGTCVTIVATPTGSDFSAAVSQSVEIRLVPPGVILPPAGTPTAAFTVSPATVTAGVTMNFDASSSKSGTGATSITSYAWSFGDGATGTGRTTSHAFSAAGSFNVTLTVTNDRGLSASTSQSVTIGTGVAPTAAFVFSPTAPVVNQDVQFNAAASTAASGRTIASYDWNFGDGSTKTGQTATHDFGAAGSYNVTLTVTDDVGQRGTTTQTVTVTAPGGGGPTPVPTASFVFSPSAPAVNQDVFFNASSSLAAAGRTIVSYAWDFGDGATATGITSTHTYTRAGTFTVTLVIRDDIGQSGTTSRTVTVSAVSGQIVADFTFSPTDPKISLGTNTVFFDATPSSAGVVTWVWDFGDGSAPGAGQKPSHTYTLPGTWVVRLTVTDGSGRTATTTKSVTVSP